MRLLRFTLVFAICWSVALLPLAGTIAMAQAGNMTMSETGDMAMVDSAPRLSELTIGSAHDCCEKDQAPVDHMKNCQAASACAKCFNFFYALLSAPIIHPPLIKAEALIIVPAAFSSPHHLPFRPPRA